MNASTSILKIKIASTNYSDEIAIRYMSGATVGYDGCCDAWKFFSGNAAVPNLFTRTDAGDELAINSLPSLNGTNDVALFVRIGASATYSITSTQADSFAAFTLITLIDNVTGISYNLKTTNTYTINLPVIVLGESARFSIKVIPPPAVMPVELIKFTARTEKRDVLLSWTTASEENSESFIMERAEVPAFPGSGEMQFLSVGNLPGQGNSTIERNYMFVDQLSSIEGEGPEVWYYRLKQIDLNDTYKYFGPIAVMCSADDGTEINVYPSVSAGTFFIEGDINNSEINIYSVAGRIIYSEQMQKYSANERVRIEIPNEPNGIYFLKATKKGKETVQKIIINH